MNFASKVIDYHFALHPSDWALPSTFELIYPFEDAETRRVFTEFYTQFFSDQRKRHLLFGINPGRFGAGVTGVPFTDPVIMKTACQITHDFSDRHELSSKFIYELIHELGGVEAFYQRYYISSLCPLGFLREGKNANYYDDRSLFLAVKTNMVRHIQAQIDFGAYTDKAYCIGMGMNLEYFEKLNEEYAFFEKIIPLPHPRWVMQYKKKDKLNFLNQYIRELRNV